VVLRVFVRGACDSFDLLWKTAPMTDLISRADAIAVLRNRVNAKRISSRTESNGFRWIAEDEAYEVLRQLPARPMPAPDISGVIEKIKERCDLSEKHPMVYLDDVEEILRASTEETAADVAKHPEQTVGDVSLDWEEALDSLHQSANMGDVDGWEIELVRRRVKAALAAMPTESEAACHADALAGALHHARIMATEAYLDQDGKSIIAASDFKDIEQYLLEALAAHTAWRKV